MSNKVLSLEKLDDEKKNHSHYKNISQLVDAVNIAVDFVSGISEEITVTASSESLPLSASIKVNSAGVGAAAKLAMNSLGVPKIAKELRYALGVEEEDIFFEKE